MPRQFTIGQLLVRQAVPEDLREEIPPTLDKKGVTELLKRVAEKHPDSYAEVSKALSDVGRKVAYQSGGMSFGLQHLRQTPSAVKARQVMRQQIDQLLDDDSLSSKARNEKILALMANLSERQEGEVLQEALDAGNPLAMQVLSGSRGNPTNLARLIASDVAYTDHRGRVQPIPVFNSYSQGLTPEEYWAATYGARTGLVETKLGVADAGYLSKILNQLSHRLLISGVDAKETAQQAPGAPRGLPVELDDPDNVGALLAAPAGSYERNTILTSKILNDLRRKGLKRLLVRSPTVGGPDDGGVYARDVGVREFGRLPSTGETVGMVGAQAIGEKLSQAKLSSKHTSGVSGKGLSGFALLEALIMNPKTLRGAAAHAQEDGFVGSISEGPAGGQLVSIEGKQHYISPGFEIFVKPGDKVEAGDVISEGVPQPRQVVQHKGIGEGRRYFTKVFGDALRSSGLKVDRRNVELIARGLIDHVRLDEEIGDYVPDDVISYQTLERAWKPRPGYQTVAPKKAVGRYLERPYLHYSIGDKIRPSMLRDFEDFGVKEVDVSAEPPPWQPELIRGPAILHHDPDWMTQLYSSGLQKNLLRSTHVGATADEGGTSFVPGLARSVDFGRQGKVKLQPPTPPVMPGWRTKLNALREQLTKQAEMPRTRPWGGTQETPLWLQRMVRDDLGRGDESSLLDYAEFVQPMHPISILGQAAAVNYTPNPVVGDPTPYLVPEAVGRGAPESSWGHGYSYTVPDAIKEYNQYLQTSPNRFSESDQPVAEMQRMILEQLHETQPQHLTAAIENQQRQQLGPAEFANRIWTNSTPEQRQARLGHYFQQMYGQDAPPEFYQSEGLPEEYLYAMGAHPSQLEYDSSLSPEEAEWQRLSPLERMDKLRQQEQYANASMADLRDQVMQGAPSWQPAGGVSGQQAPAPQAPAPQAPAPVQGPLPINPDPVGMGLLGATAPFWGQVGQQAGPFAGLAIGGMLNPDAMRQFVDPGPPRPMAQPPAVKPPATPAPAPAPTPAPPVKPPTMPAAPGTPNTEVDFAPNRMPGVASSGKVPGTNIPRPPGMKSKSTAPL